MAVDAIDAFFHDTLAREMANAGDNPKPVEDLLSDAHGEPPDGSTTPPRTDDAGGGGRLKVGVWWDIGASNTFNHLDDHVRLLRELHVDNVTVMINRYHDRQFGFASFSAERLVTFGERLRAEGIGLVLDSWVYPRRDFIDGLVAALPQVAVESHARALEFDSEGTWQDATVRGYDSLDAAGADLIQKLRPAARANGFELGVTIHTGRLNPSVSRLADFVAIQCYTVWKSEYANDASKNKNYGLNGVWGPGGRQRLGYAKAKALQGPRPIIGLAAWGQNFPHTAPEVSLGIAAETVLGFADVAEVKYWSWKWIGGTDGTKRSPPYAFQFIQRLASGQPIG